MSRAIGRRALLALGGALLSAGPAGATAVAAKRGNAGRPAPAGARRIGIALGAGSARGFAHIGVLQALEEAGISPSVIAGSSAGSLVGVFYASGFTPWQMQDIALKVRDIDVADLSTGNKRGMISGRSLQRLVNGFVKDVPIEKMPRQFGAVSTDLDTGETVVLRQGDAGTAVMSSCSIPGVFIPSTNNGRELVDGGLTSPLPVKVARQMGADYVIAVDVGTQPGQSQRSGLYEIILQSFEIMVRSIARLEGQTADLLIRPDTQRFASADFSVRKELIEAGYLAGKRALPQIKKDLGLPA